ncbi:putative membrane protein [Kineococcus xinjiangensis]|uniref:Putative membrane protein n=1 Tax=Kineococcus xinjiangensis TaxID=512762 RepID=A0A2S6IFA0_9ACTN|nr:DUF2254 domain-containing protein [Kineococcus xinjiangensis]PPK92866.1 putative membrane protein [Kineococcus xinjiangensis]
MRQRKGSGAERSGAAVWVWPAGAGALALVAALVLAQIRPEAQTLLSRLAWPGGTDSATTMLQAIAAASISTITLTFSLTVVALQLASQQFSPRLLRDFMRDPWTKSVLAVLVATFVFSLTVLRGLRPDAPVPAAAVFTAFVLGIASMAAVLGFINHLTTLLRVDTMMLTVHNEARRAIDAFYPDYGDHRPRRPEELGVDWTAGTSVAAPGSGFVRRVDVSALVQAAEGAEAVVWIDVRPGDHVVRGTPFATVHAPHLAHGKLEELEEAIRSAVVVGYERTVEQDSAYGFRQLTDIAVKALSPGINDPVTAAHCIGHAADLLVQLEGKRLGPTLHEDSRGVGRVVVPDRDIRYYLDLVCGQIRRYGGREPTVLVALLRMLRDMATAVREDTNREEIERQVDLILAEVPDSLAAVDVQRVEDLAHRVRATLAGDVRRAYQDRAGETRSL